jgi:hypothetical protein
VWVEVHPAAPIPDTSRVSESLRGFAHEIRNPLAAISGAAQLLEQRAGAARERSLAQLIRGESARLATLAERLLGTRSTMATRVVNVHAILERASELLQTERGDVAVVRDYDPSLPAWHGDPDRLLQAVLNLVRNAAEAHATRIVLRSRAEAGWRDAHGQRVPALRIEVEDDGDGVPEAIAATLVAPMVSGRADGTGLGLALAREIEGLGQIIGRAFAIRGSGGRDVGEGAHHDHRQRRMRGLDVAEQNEAVRAGEAHVAHHQLRCAPAQRGSRAFGIGEFGDFVAGVAQRRRQHEAHRPIVVDDEDFAHPGSPGRGRRGNSNTKQAPTARG